MSTNGSLDLVALTLSHNSNALLGVLLAVAENPEIVPRIIKQLREGGPLGQEIAIRYESAKALLESVP